MVESTSVSSFLLDGRLVDVVALQFETRNFGGAQLHRVAQQICILSCLAADLHDGFDIDVERARISFSEINKQITEAFNAAKKAR